MLEEECWKDECWATGFIGGAVLAGGVLGSGERGALTEEQERLLAALSSDFLTGDGVGLDFVQDFFLFFLARYFLFLMSPSF